jgi:ABC-2 type transport system ATP-binding protein
MSSTPDALWASQSVRLMHPAAIVVRRLRRRVRGRGVLDGVNLEIPVGARLLLVSRPEGSGSLLLRVLAGLVRPTSGTVLLAGLSRADDSAAGWARRVAYLPPQPDIYPWLAPAEALDLAARLAGYDRGERVGRIEAVVEEFGLQTDLERPISRGGAAVAQKTALAAAMLTDPEVLLLDEPLRSVPPAERTALLRLPGARRTVLLTSRHPASEAGVVTDVALLRDGRVALQTSTADLQQHELPLSLPGIEALADLHAAALPAASSV